MTELSAAEYVAMQEGQKRGNKYGAKPVVIDGIRFDSTAEGNRYAELKLMEEHGAIRGLVLQPRYNLYVNEQKVGDYVGDFYYWDNERNVPVLEDVKGVKTPVYRLKKRIMKAQYGIEIVEVRGQHVLRGSVGAVAQRQAVHRQEAVDVGRGGGDAAVARAGDAVLRARRTRCG